MTLTFSDPIAPHRRGDGRALSVQSFDLLERGLEQSPIVMLDDFHVHGRPFGPHPHAGFSAVTYVFEDSPGRLRSRDSLGNDHVVGRGGIVWTQAANGVMHEELLVEPALELHGLQFFVNLTGGNKAIPAEVFALNGYAVPLWDGAGGDRVRIVVGEHAGIASPLRPAEPFTLLDIELAAGLDLVQPENWFGVIYAREGAVEIAHAGERIALPAGQAVTVEGGGSFRLEAQDKTRGVARPLYLAGPQVGEAVVQRGPFIMRQPAEIDAAIERFQRGEMGRLARYAGD